MHDEYYFTDQNEVKSSDLHIFFENYPVIKPGQEILVKKTVPGRGNVWLRTGTFSDTEISMVLDVNVTGKDVSLMDAYTEVRRRLKKCSEISFCDASDYFYKVKNIDIDKLNQYAETAGDFSVKMICAAGIFRKDGKSRYEAADVLENPYDESHPEYIITGEGVCTLNVNGNMMTANVGQNICINTDKMISYRTDGNMQNTAVSGRYSNLYLNHGKNTISITEGFTLQVIPNWRCI